MGLLCIQNSSQEYWTGESWGAINEAEFYISTDELPKELFSNNSVDPERIKLFLDETYQPVRVLYTAEDDDNLVLAWIRKY
jgi:hypothetical protein